MTREGRRTPIPAPTQLPTADLALRPLHRAGLVAGPRNGGVQYARLRTAVTLYTTGFQRNGLPDRRRADIGSPRGVLVPQYSELPSYRATDARSLSPFAFLQPYLNTIVNSTAEGSEEANSRRRKGTAPAPPRVCARRERAEPPKEENEITLIFRPRLLALVASCPSSLSSNYPPTIPNCTTGLPKL